MALSSPQNSTIVRISWTRRRGFFHVAELVAPRLGGRVARDLWFTAPPRMAAPPLPPGGEAFTVRARGVAVRGHVWGSGPVVYLMHGWGGRGSQLAAYVEPLVAAGHRVVLFDAPSHGDSDPGLSGGGRTHGLEFALALHAAAANFGPAHAVIAHSLGTVATYLAQQRGLSTDRLVLLAPMVEAESLFGAFQQALGFGPRTRREFDREVDQFVGIPVPEFDARVQAARTEPVPTLVVHDTGDPQTPYADAVSLVDALPDARMETTTGLGHRRILRDPTVVETVVDFLLPTPDRARSTSPSTLPSTAA